MSGSDAQEHPQAWPLEGADVGLADGLGDITEKGRWAQGLFQHRHPTGVIVTSDPRGALVFGTGNGLWAAGEVLADYFVEHPEICQGAICLELGSGVGVAGLTVARLGAQVVVLTDVVLQLPLLERNAMVNNPDGQLVHVRALDWTKPEHRDGLVPWADQWSLIIGCDIGYDADLFEELLDTLKSQCSPSTIVLFSLADRQEEAEPDVSDFIAAAGDAFDCEIVHERQKELGQSVNKVVRMTPRAIDGKRRKVSSSELARGSNTM